MPDGSTSSRARAWLRGCVAGTAVLAGPVPAQQIPAQQEAAAEEVETIVVAHKWREELQEAPGSITVVTGEEVEASGWRSLREASARVPSFNLTEFSSRRLSFPFVRGVGSGEGDPAVITYIDGVPQFGSGGVNLPLFDVERVEFLRGPQGTLYGRNALGGLMQVWTRRPSTTFAGEVGATVGELSTREGSFSFSGPLAGESVLGGLSALYAERDGYVVNDFTGNTVNDREGLTGRAQVLFAPEDGDSLLRLTLTGQRARDGGFVLSDLDGLQAEPYRINQDFEGVVERDVAWPALTWERFGDAVDFTSISAFQTWDVLETSDLDFSPVDGVRRRTEESQEFLYQELRVATPESAPEAQGGRTLRWLAGVSGFVSEADRSAENEFRPGGAGLLFPPANVGVARDAGRFDDLGVGVFGQATLSLEKRLELTAGLRYDYESKEADLRQTFETGGFTAVDVTRSFDESFDEILPRLSASYHVDAGLTVYGLAARGFKAGGFNLNAPQGDFAFGPETSWTYEVGAKLADGEGRFGLNASLFYVDWDDMQLSQFDPAAGGFVQNAGESTSRGAELELELRAAEGLDLYAAAGYTDAEFDSFVDRFGQDVSGNDLPFAPETTFAVGAQYTRELGDELVAFVGGGLRWVGEFYYDPGNLRDESYKLLDLRAGLQKGRWSMDVSLRNALEEEYVPVALQADPGDPTFFVGESGAPQTLTLSVRFTP